MTTAAALRPSARTGLRPVDPRRDMAGLADLIEMAFDDSLDISGRRMAQEMRRFGRLGWAGWLLGHLMLPPAAYPQGYVWVEGGRLVGNASLMPVEGTALRWVLANVAVHPQHRRRGIARSLVGACLSLAERQRAGEVVLQVKEDNQAARDLYRAFGFADRCLRVSWRKTQPAERGNGWTPARRSRTDDWPGQWALSQRVAPLGVVWPHPLRLSFFRPSPWYAADPWSHWVWPSQGLLQASLSARSDPDGGTQMYLICAPEARGKAEAPLLELGLSEAFQRGGPIRLESEDGEGEPILRGHGFSQEHRLTWMRWEKPSPAKPGFTEKPGTGPAPPAAPRRR